MKVVHVQAPGVSSKYDTSFIKMVVSMVDGVRDVAAISSLGLVSVLYEEQHADAADVIEAVCSAGFGARECLPADTPASAAPAA